MKELIEEYCASYQTSLRMMKTFPNDVKVTFFSGIKPAGYNVPQMVFSTKQALAESKRKIDLAWYCEVFVDGLCLFRDSMVPSDDLPMDKLEDVLCKKTMKAIAIYGLDSCRQMSKKLEERKRF